MHTKTPRAEKNLFSSQAQLVFTRSASEAPSVFVRLTVPGRSGRCPPQPHHRAPRALTPPDDAAFRASAAGSRSVSPLQRLRVRTASRSSPLAPRPVRLAPARAAVTPDKGIFKKLSPKTVAAGYEAAGRLQRSRLLEARLLEARAPECLLRPLCNISLELPTDPVVACDGHVYERSAISEWIGRSAVLGADPVSPVSGERMASGPLATSFQTRERIEACPCELITVRDHPTSS